MGGKQPVASIGSGPSGSDDFQVYSARPDVRFLSRGVQPPSQVYVATGDDIVVACASSAANESVIFSYRLLRADGLIILGQFAVRPASNRLVTTYQESLAEGFLLSVSCRATVASTRGVTFVRVSLTDPALGNGQPSYVLFADYVTNQMSPAHPNGRVLAPTEGPGNIRAVIAGSPPAGTDCQIAVPTNARQRILSFFCSLTTGAVAGNRQPLIQLSSAGVGVFTAPFNAVVVAGTFVQMTAAPASQNVPAAGGFLFAPVPVNFVLQPAGVIATLTNGILAADQYANVQMLVEEWLDDT